MISKQRAASALLALLAFALAGCGGSTNQSDSTTHALGGSSANVPRIKVKLGPCPARFPRVKLATLNERAHALDTKLVPFAATSARVCTYSLAGLVASVALPSAGALELERATNALPKFSAPITCPAATRHVSRLFLVTFDDAVQRVHLRETDACGGRVTNGVVTAKETKPWAAAVVQAATKRERRRATPG